MALPPDIAGFSRLITALDPWLDRVVIVGGWAHRLYHIHPAAQKLDFAPLMTLDADVALPRTLPAQTPTIREALVSHGFQEEFRGNDMPPATLSSRGLGRGVSEVKKAPPSTSSSPVGFGFRYTFDPLSFATDVLHWNPDEKQREALNARRARRILNWARQCGKTEVAAVEAIHVACTRPGSLIVVIGGVQDHINQFFNRIDMFFEEATTSTSDPFGGPVTKPSGNRIVRRFPNRSRIVGLTTNKAVRSHTARFIILDESGYIDDRVWEGVLPTLATTDGNILVIGTPRGARGWYYDLWNNKKNAVGPRGWFKSQYPAADNPRISRDYLEEMRMTCGDTWMRQDFCCEFLHDGQTLLHPDDVDAIFEYKG
jgi:hypothetical protein